MDEMINGKITVLSPVHIGSGRGNLTYDYDFVTDGQFIRVIDHERMFIEVDEEIWQGADVDVRISRLLEPEQYELCSLYSLEYPGGAVNSIMEHIKDGHYRPYIPGSSLKGAIRTALAFAMVKSGVVKVRENDLGRSRISAGSSIEAELFGANPNRDMMRALQVVDTPGIDVSSGLALSTVALYSITGNRVLTPKGPGFTFNVECIPPDTELELCMKLDSQLLRDDVSKQLGFDTRKGWLTEFPRHCNAFAQELIDLEIEFYTACSVPRVKDFYQRMKDQMGEMDSASQFLVQIAWGTGWSAKTVGEALDKDILSEAIGRFGLGKGHPVFPKTRRLVEQGGAAEMPMGWVRVDLQRPVHTWL